MYSDICEFTDNIVQKLAFSTSEIKPVTGQHFLNNKI